MIRDTSPASSAPGRLLDERASKLTSQAMQ